MKSIKFFVIILSLGLLMTCNSNDDLPENFATWSLTNVTGGLAGANDNFEAGLITWRFYEETNLLEVTNNNEVDSLMDILETGTYYYSVEDEEDDFHIFIDGQDYGVISKTTHTIIIDQQVNDGFVITLRR